MEDLLKAITIFVKYGNPQYPTHCEHDVMWINIDYRKVSQEDIEELDKLGFFTSDEDGERGFKSFRFGKC